VNCDCRRRGQRPEGAREGGVRGRRTRAVRALVLFGLAAADDDKQISAMCMHMACGGARRVGAGCRRRVFCP